MFPVRRESARKLRRFRFGLRSLLYGFLAASVVIGLVVTAIQDPKLATGLALLDGLPCALIFVYIVLLARHNRALWRMEFLDELQLATREGRPLPEAVERLRAQADGSAAIVLAGVHRVVSDTGSLTAGLDLHPRIFPPELRTSLRAAERLNVLEKVLPHLRHDLLSRRAADHRLALSFLYPLSLTVLLVMFRGLILPKMHAIIESVGRPDPHPSDLLNGFTVASIAVWLFVGFVVLQLGWELACLLGARPRLTGLLARIPLFGRSIFGASAANYATLAGALLAANVPLHEAHRAAAEAEASPSLRKRWLDLLPALTDGASFASAVERLDFPERCRAVLVRAGMAADLPSALQTAATTLARGVHEWRMKLARAVFPATLAVFGLAVGAIWFGVFDWWLAVEHAVRTLR